MVFIHVMCSVCDNGASHAIEMNKHMNERDEFGEGVREREKEIG